MEIKEKQRDYQAEISANISPEEAFDKISRVPEWWGTNFEGKSTKVNDEFTVRFPNGDMYKIRISEIDPNKRIVWEVIDGFQTWVKNPSEWKGTKIEWDIRKEKNGRVSIDLTHLGLVPEIECFDRCTRGWNWLMQESLSKFLTEGKGLPV